MSVLIDMAYAIAAIPGLPILARKSWRTGKYRTGLAARFGFGEETLPPPFRRAPGIRVLLLHCVSVGELNSVATLIQKLLAADNKLHIVVTTTTDTGTDRAAKLYPARDGSRVSAVRFPFDFSFAMERLFDRVMPDAVALVELETWPNFLSIAQSRRIRVVLINGRLSEKSFPRYRLIRPVMAWMLRKLAWIGVQTDAIAGRLAALGARSENLEVIPTLKYDNAHVADHMTGQEALARAMGLEGAREVHPLFVAGSTGPGEEQAVLSMYDTLRGRYPALRLAIAPRHPEVVAQVVEAVKARGLLPVLRSERPDAPGHEQDAGATMKTQEVFVLNTMGELRKLYALAFAAFVGRSLFKKGGGGSDMIEVAALGKPCCFGKYTSNFAEVVELLVREGTAVQVADGAAMAQVVERWLADPAGARAAGRRAQELIRRQQGSTQRYVERLLAVLRFPPIRQGADRRPAPTHGEVEHG